ncbi:MAG: septum site-determining protein MinC [Anaerolineales bacterium]|nr:septum site-determining protein MinC [Anaerolineales bacterium]MCW5854871.1 septum site-determining protein MinC [Anaerolineales bacterium]
MTDKVQIKGIREGLLVSVVENEGDWSLAEKELLSELDRQKGFLQGAKLILDVNEHGINAAAMGRLRDQISDHGLSLWGVLSRSPLTERSAQAMGLATRIHQTEREAESAEGHSFDPNSDAVLVRRTLRSGASITHAGHVTLIGDLNPGAEIIAGGDVIIWGRLRGLVHAGAEGNEDAVVCALDLAPTQLRIAGHIAIPPQERGQPSPEVAFVRDGQVIAEPWEPGKAIK